MYVYGCDTGVYPCAGANRQAMDPVTGQFVGTTAQASVIVGTLVPGHGQSRRTASFRPDKGIAETGFTYPALGYAPRFGAAWDVKGDQTFVVRGGIGLFFDRPPANSIYGTVNNPPASQNVTVRYGLLQDIGSAGLTTVGAAAADRVQYDNKLPCVVSVERRPADGAAVRERTRRLVHRPAQLQHAGDRQPQHHRSRDGVPAAVPGSDADAQPA